jgi:hypothetical protein
MVLSEQERRARLEELAAAEGYATVDELIEAAALDSVSPGICVRPGCGYTVEVEPDQREGWCEACGGRSVQSALVLAELI